jgi:hypothetical protein
VQRPLLVLQAPDLLATQEDNAPLSASWVVLLEGTQVLP